MVYYLLSIAADLDNLTDLQPRGGCDDPTYPYYFKVKCEGCGEASLKESCVLISEQVPLPTGKGVAHLVQKPLTLQQSQREEYGKLMIFDSRGFEPTDFSFADGWKAQSITGTSFDVDLSAGEFAEYDEKGNLPVGIVNVRAKFSIVRRKERQGRKDSFI